VAGPRRVEARPPSGFPFVPVPDLTGLLGRGGRVKALDYRRASHHYVNARDADAPPALEMSP